MPLYAIRRNVGFMNADEVDAAAFRASVCAYEFPGLSWVRSFWDSSGGEIMCYYEAVDETQVREHSRKANIPCDAVYPVTELLPDGYSSNLQTEELHPVAG